jgi:hypothetical protein
MRHRRFIALGALLLFVPAAHAAEPFTYAGPAGRVQIDGPWVLRSDHHNSGIRLGWGRGGFVGSEVTVPFATSANPHRLTGKKGIRMYEGTIAWYRTTFHVPRAGRYAIDFQSVNHRATVWIDGDRIGKSHEGEFQPFTKTFSADGAGEHLLVVRADYSHIEHQKETGWHRTWFNFGGINREVTVRPLGRSDISGPDGPRPLDGRRGRDGHGDDPQPRRRPDDPPARCARARRRAHDDPVPRGPRRGARDANGPRPRAGHRAGPVVA